MTPSWSVFSGNYFSDVWVFNIRAALNDPKTITRFDVFNQLTLLCHFKSVIFSNKYRSNLLFCYFFPTNTGQIVSSIIFPSKQQSNLLFSYFYKDPNALSLFDRVPFSTKAALRGLPLRAGSASCPCVPAWRSSVPVPHQSPNATMGPDSRLTAW